MALIFLDGTDFRVLHVYLILRLILRFNFHSNFCDFADSADLDAKSSHDHFLTRLDCLLKKFIIFFKSSAKIKLIYFTDASWAAGAVALTAAIEAA
jgi:hypothetical protein